MENQTLKKNQTFTCTVHDLNDDAQGVVRVNDYVGFVDGVLPGEKIEICITKCKPDFFLADCITRMSDSPNRSTPFCEHFDTCGGCKLQHLTYSAHAHIKLAQWQNLYKKMLGEACPVKPETVFVTPKAYRRKARISCRYVAKKGKVCVGFREKQGRFVLDGAICPLLASHPALFTELSNVLTPLSIAEHIPQVEYLYDSKHTHLIFRVLTSPNKKDVEALKLFCDNHKFKGSLQINKNVGVIPLSKSIDEIMQDLLQQHTSIQNIQYETLGYTINAHYQDFIQVNRQINDQLVKQVVEWAKDAQPGKVLDLFCGLGNFSIPLSFHSKQTLGVEISQSMVEKAQENARTNMSNATFRQADLTQISSEHWPYGTADWLIIDPPRSGAKEITQITQTINPSTVIYISCNPATLMRDLAVLFQHGYKIQEVILYDMFAQTTHLETLVKLSCD